MANQVSNKSFYFSKDTNGKDIFYPWQFPGEAYYLNEKHIKQIRLINNIIGMLMVAVFMMSMHYNDSDSPPENSILGMWILILLYPVFSLIYFISLITYITKQKLLPAILAHQSRLPALVRILLTILIVEVLVILAALHFHPDYQAFKLMLILAPLIDVSLIGLAIKTQGFILQNKPKR
jgi:hypothetical protein